MRSPIVNFDDTETIAKRYRPNNHIMLIPNASFLLSNSSMDNKETRRLNMLALVERHETIKKLADMIDVPPSYLSQIKNGGRHMGDALARKFEVALGLNYGAMDTLQITSNTEPGPDVRGRVPLISWVQAGDWCEAVNSFAHGDAEMWLPCPKAFGANAFALRVRGVSMEPRYQNGDIIFVDPDVQPEHGKNVVVRLDDDKEATFKQLVIEGSQKYLKALNPDFPGPRFLAINGNATIVGVVIGKWVPE